MLGFVSIGDTITGTGFRKFRDTDTITDTLETYLDS